MTQRWEYKEQIQGHEFYACLILKQKSPVSLSDNARNTYELLFTKITLPPISCLWNKYIFLLYHTFEETMIISKVKDFSTQLKKDENVLSAVESCLLLYKF